MKKNKYFVGRVGCSRTPNGPKWIDNRPWWYKAQQWLNGHLNPFEIKRARERKARNEALWKALGLREVKLEEQVLIRNEITEIKPYDVPRGLIFYTDYKFDSPKDE